MCLCIDITHLMDDNTILFHDVVSSEECTNGFLDTLSVDNYDPRRLVPLLGRQGFTTSEQWIFPDLLFTCHGTLTRWIIRAVPGQATQCRINIGTWRLDTTTTYRKLSSTEGNARITTDGPLFTYELRSPVNVRPGDIVGVELDTFSCSLFASFDNILTLDISGTGSSSWSYGRRITGSTFVVRGAFSQQNNLVPLLQPVFGELIN